MIDNPAPSRTIHMHKAALIALLGGLLWIPLILAFLSFGGRS